MDDDVVYHTPISVTLVSVGPVPYVRELPSTVEVRITLTMDREGYESLLAEIEKQKLINPEFVAVELKTHRSR